MKFNKIRQCVQNKRPKKQSSQRFQIRKHHKKNRVNKKPKTNKLTKYYKKKNHKQSKNHNIIKVQIKREIK